MKTWRSQMRKSTWFRSSTSFCLYRNWLGKKFGQTFWLFKPTLPFCNRRYIFKWLEYSIVMLVNSGVYIFSYFWEDKGRYFVSSAKIRIQMPPRKEYKDLARAPLVAGYSTCLGAWNFLRKDGKINFKGSFVKYLRNLPYLEVGESWPQEVWCSREVWGMLRQSSFGCFPRQNLHCL